MCLRLSAVSDIDLWNRMGGKLGLMQLEITVKTEIAKGELKDTGGMIK